MFLLALAKPQLGKSTPFPFLVRIPTQAGH
jgi:hypothetical protein